MEVLRKFGVILAVAVLLAIFIFALADAFVPEEAYPAFCEQNQEYRYYAEPLGVVDETECTPLAEPTQEEIDACPGRLYPDRTKGGCPTKYICDCAELREAYSSQEDNIRFWIAIVLGFVAIVIGILLPAKNPLNAWIGGGAILGGLISIFIATSMYWRHIDKIARPVVIALELALVIYLAYRQFGPKRKKK